MRGSDYDILPTSWNGNLWSFPRKQALPIQQDIPMICLSSPFWATYGLAHSGRLASPMPSPMRIQHGKPSVLAGSEWLPKLVVNNLKIMGWSYYIDTHRYGEPLWAEGRVLPDSRYSRCFRGWLCIDSHVVNICMHIIGYLYIYTYICNIWPSGGWPWLSIRVSNGIVFALVTIVRFHPWCMVFPNWEKRNLLQTTYYIKICLGWPKTYV